MDKKIIYYIVAGVVLVVTVAVIVAMQNSKGGNSSNPVVKITKNAAPAKSETQAAQDMGKELGGVGMPLRITMDDNNQTISLTPGKNLVIMLGTDYNWDISTSDDKVLAKRDVKITDARVQAAYQAVGSGKVILSATGTCKKSACEPKTQTFKLNTESLVTDNLTAEELMK